MYSGRRRQNPVTVTKRRTVTIARRRRKNLGVGLLEGGPVQTARGLSPPKAKILATCLWLQL